MSEPETVAARLRDCTCVPHGDICREAADEIERLRRDYSCICGEMRRMMEERDEARREICLLRASSTNATEKVSFEMIAYAASRGWDDLFADTGKHERDA